MADFYGKNNQITGLPDMKEFMEGADSFFTGSLNEGRAPVMIAFRIIGIRALMARYGIEEGNRFILNFVDLLRLYFGQQHCTRMEEHCFFAYGAGEGAVESIPLLLNDVSKLENGSRIRVKVGIYNRYSEESIIEEACNRAFMACNHKRHTSDSSSILYFDDGMQEELEVREFVLNNLDQALKDGSIKVYYQFHTRLLNKMTCGAEALIRWEDKTRGFISPNVFIPILEESSLTWKVDTFVIHEITRDIKSLMEMGCSPIPVSFNLTYSDFLIIDVPETVNSIVEDTGLDPGLFTVEVTEETVLRNPDFFREEIDKLHSMGFHAMIDDFGNGYSSINLLNDFRFDSIKIDIEFMRSFNDRNRKIVESIVVMAKNLGIYTVTEGVETKEQLQFLERVGCQAVQGYYFGRPEPSVDFVRNLKDHRNGFEDVLEQELFNKAGLTNFITDRAMMIVRFHKDRFRLYYANEEVERLLTHSGYTLDDIFEHLVNDPENERARIFRRSARRMIQTGRNTEVSFSLRGRSFRLENRLLAENTRGLMICTYVYETEGDEGVSDRGGDEQILRNILPSYNNIYYVDLKENTVRIIRAEFGYELAGNEYNYENFLDNYLKKGCVFPSDRERFIHTFDSVKLSEKLNTIGNSGFIDIFRMKTADVYKWVCFRLNAIHGSGGTRVIICATVIERTVQADFIEMSRRILGYRGVFADEEGSIDNIENNRAVFLWNSLMDVSDVKYFWKDGDRRFLGASRSFLDFYGLELHDILGKNDEEIGWHPDDTQYRSDEYDVLEKGTIIRNSPGQIYAKGAKVNILATKYPLYRNGQIVGILGYFMDTDTVLSDEEEMDHALFVDLETGYLNARGLFLVVQGMDDNYRKNGTLYGVSTFEVAEYIRIFVSFGKEEAERLAAEVGRIVSGTFGGSVEIARTQLGGFTVCIKDRTEDELEELNRRCIDNIKSINDISGLDGSLTVSCGSAHGSERSSVQEILSLMLMRLYESRKYNGVELDSHEDIINILPDIKKDLPLPLMVLRPVVSERGVADVRFVFVNNKYCEYTGLSRKDLVGKKYRELFREEDKDWLEFVGRAANGETVNGRAYISHVGQWMEFIGMPSSIPGCCSTIFWPVGDIKKERDLLTKGHMADNALIKVAGYLNDTDDFDKAVYNSLKEVGRVLSSDRVYILDTGGMPLYEWCDDGIMSRKEIGENAPVINLERLRPHFIEDGCRMVDDVEVIKKYDPEAYSFIKKQEIVCYIFVPLYNSEGEIMGIIGADNYKKEKVLDPARIVKEVGYFISSKMIAYHLMRKLNILSNRDELTGLLNRHGFRSEMDRYLFDNPDDTFTIVLIDVDDFKIINDMYGHATGDEVLVNLAEDLNTIFAEKAIIARSGGDELSVCIMNSTAAEAEGMLKELSEMEHTFVFDGNVYYFRLSIGYAEYPTQTRDISMLLRQADAALYSVKSEGKHGYKQYSSGIKTAKRLQLAFNLKNVARNLPGAILVYRAEGDKKILFANEELISMFECSTLEEFIELTGGTFDGVVHPEEIDTVDRAIWDQIDNNSYNGKNYVDYRIITKTGRVKEVIDVGRFEENEFYGKVFYVILIDKGERKSSRQNKYE